MVERKCKFEARSGERGVGEGGGVPPLPIWKKMEISKCLDDF